MEETPLQPYGTHPCALAWLLTLTLYKEQGYGP